METFVGGESYLTLWERNAGKRGSMLLKLNEPLIIEDMQHNSAEGMRRLRYLLLRGTASSEDANRKGFYDIEDGFRVFYIHICPSGKVLLLAIWAKDGAPLQAHTAAQMAWTSVG